MGNKIKIEAILQLGELTTDDVSVEIYHGYISTENHVINGSIERMMPDGQHQGNTYTFAGEVTCNHSGLYGYTIRVLPKHGDLVNPHETGLITWAN